MWGRKVGSLKRRRSSGTGDAAKGGSAAILVWIAAVLFFGERLNFRSVLGIILILCGVSFIVINKQKIWFMGIYR